MRALLFQVTLLFGVHRRIAGATSQAAASCPANIYEERFGASVASASIQRGELRWGDDLNAPYLKVVERTLRAALRRL